jgi:glycosyltransferase involved in cell wall biosynthesis
LSENDVVSHRKTIVLISRDLGLGGSQRKIATVARHFSDLGGLPDGSLHLLIKDEPPADLEERALYDSVAASPIRIHRKSAAPFFLFCAWQTWKLQPTVIVAFLRGMALRAVALKYLFWWRRICVIVSEDCMPSLALKEQVPSRLKASLLTSLMRIGYRRADRVIVPSDAAGSDLIGNFSIPAGLIGINRNWTEAPLVESSTLPAFDLVYVGRITPVKNLQLLVEIIHELRRRRPDLRAAIVGAGKDLPAVLELRQRLGLEQHLSFPGWQRDVSTYLSRARIYCLTSHHEGLPIAALEAMAHGLPVITTSWPGAHELVEQGVTGFVCASLMEYVECVCWLLDHDPERAEMGRRACEFVRTHHGQANLIEFIDTFTNPSLPVSQ